MPSRPMRVACSVLLAIPAPAQEQVATLRLPRLFQDHMVFQQRATAPIWGQAGASATVTVHASWGGGDMTAVADDSGRFSIPLSTPAAGGPFTVEITAPGASVTLRDVLVGEVWVGSGQSNMEMSVAQTAGYSGVKDWQQEVASANWPQIRLFTVENTCSKDAQADVRGSWKACSPETVGPFSATLYFFGRKLYRELAVPIGLISADWGGTPAEAWMSPKALQKHGGFDAALSGLASMPSDLSAAKLRERRAAWWKALEMPAAGSTWKTLALPQPWSGTELADFDGIAWFEREVELPASFAKQRLTLTLPAIDDMDVVAWNGALVAGTYDEGKWKDARRYTIPANAAQAGKNRLTLGVLDTGGEGGVLGEPRQMALAHGKESIALAGEWRWQKGKALAELPPLPRGRGYDQNTPSALFHGMIEPLVPFAVAGFTWYQGESNRTRAEQYRTLFPALIQDWRAQWQATLPFYFVQIAPFGYANDKGEAFALRVAQAQALALEKTGMAVTTDVGDPKDIHPNDKQTVGDRLARHALHKTYGKTTIPCESPSCAAVAAAGNALRVTFAHAEKGLVARNGAVRGFQIAGQDGTFHPAEATIDGAAVVVRSPQVDTPAAVRFLGGAADESNLFSADGLPVGPFEARR